MINQINSLFYWSQLTEAHWSLPLAATEQGLCFVGAVCQSLDEATKQLSSQFSDSTLKRNDDKLQPYIRELAQYLRGERVRFSFPVVMQGTPFQTAVWDALLHIPYGQTASYSQIAQHIGKPDAVRAVGAAIGANPVLIAVPCHRVIGKNGTLTGYRGGLEMKKQLLTLEQSS